MDENISLVTESGGRLPQKKEQAHSTRDLYTFTASTSTDGHEGRSRSWTWREVLSQRRSGMRVLPKGAAKKEVHTSFHGSYGFSPRRPTASSFPIHPAKNPVCAKLTGPTIGCLSCRAPARRKVNGNNQPIPLATFGIFSSMQWHSSKQTFKINQTTNQQPTKQPTKQPINF